VVSDDPELQTVAEQRPKAVVDLAAPTGAHADHAETVAGWLSFEQRSPVVFMRTEPRCIQTLEY
jgi:hypothetical protein